MAPTRLVLGLVILAIVNIVSAQVLCSRAPVHEIAVGSVIARFKGGDMELLLANANGSLPLTGLSWKIDRFIERTRTYIVDNTIPTYQCVGPRQNVLDWLDPTVTNHFLDPLEPYNATKACTGRDGPRTDGAIFSCGHIVNEIVVSDLLCNQSSYTELIEGVKVQTIQVRMTHRDFSDMEVMVTYQIADEDVRAAFPTITNYTQFVSYLANRVKITYEVANYPFVDNTPDPDHIDGFQGGYTNQSFVTMWWNLTSGVSGASDVFIAAAQSTTYFQFDYNATIKGAPVSVQSTIDAYYYMDGTLRENGGTQFALTPPLGPFSGFAPLGVNIAFDMCPNNKSHWKTVFYDPSFGAFFSPLSTPMKDKNKSLVIGLSVGITLGLVAIIAVVIILALTYRPVKEFFQPYSRRDRPRKDKSANDISMAQVADGHSPAPSGWVKPQKPEL